MTRKKKIKQQKRATNKPRQKSLSWQQTLRKSLIALAFLVVIAAPMAFYSNKIAAEQDLSVIGNGLATVVQIHDPGCQLCMQLKRNLKAAAGGFKDDVQFKIANIKTDKGKQFASKYNVGHVTLLLFDKNGRRVNTLQGVRSSAEIKVALNTLVRP